MTLTKRINIVLPATTIRTIDRMVRPGQRSRFINQRCNIWWRPAPKPSAPNWNAPHSATRTWTAK
ncbi:MAG TPA: hypothetical protein VEU96_28395 [Bryobacteraceae bacterium]|nr:hypothetical protein [Bryobacteraceae bacterium]